MNPPGQILTVVLWMTGTLLSFSVMAIAVRGMSGTLSIVEILTSRATIGLSVILALMALRPELRLGINQRRIGLHLLRNTVHFGSQYVWAWSLLLLPLATVFALEFTMPAWTIVLAPFFLGERMTPSRIGAVILGITGVLVIVRPGLGTFQPAALLVLLCALGYAIQIIATKKLTETDSTFAIVFWMNLMQLAIGLSIGLIGSGTNFFGALNWSVVPSMLAFGLAGLFAHYCMTNAFRAGDASLVVPLDFLRIPLIAVVGWWLYAEALDVYVFAGAALIISGILWNLRAETRRPAAVVDAANVVRNAASERRST